MVKHKELINNTISKRKEKLDELQKFAYRNKTGDFSRFNDYNKFLFDYLVFNNKCDGVKLFFNNTTVVLNGKI